MRALLSFALCSGILLATTSAQAHPLPVRPKVVYQMEHKAPAIVLADGGALPSPVLPPAVPMIMVDYVDVKEHKPTWPREVAKPELEYDAVPLLAPPDWVS